MEERREPGVRRPTTTAGCAVRGCQTYRSNFLALPMSAPRRCGGQCCFVTVSSRAGRRVHSYKSIRRPAPANWDSTTIYVKGSVTVNSGAAPGIHSHKNARVPARANWDSTDMYERGMTVHFPKASTRITHPRVWSLFDMSEVVTYGQFVVGCSSLTVPPDRQCLR